MPGNGVMCLPFTGLIHLQGEGWIRAGLGVVVLLVLLAGFTVVLPYTVRTLSPVRVPLCCSLGLTMESCLLTVGAGVGDVGVCV